MWPWTLQSGLSAFSVSKPTGTLALLSNYLLALQVQWKGPRAVHTTHTGSCPKCADQFRNQANSTTTSTLPPGHWVFFYMLALFGGNSVFTVESYRHLYTLFAVAIIVKLNASFVGGAYVEQSLGAGKMGDLVVAVAL